MNGTPGQSEANQTPATAHQHRYFPLLSNTDAACEQPSLFLSQDRRSSLNLPVVQHDPDGFGSSHAEFRYSDLWDYSLFSNQTSTRRSSESAEQNLNWSRNTDSLGSAAADVRKQHTVTPVHFEQPKSDCTCFKSAFDSGRTVFDGLSSNCTKCVSAETLGEFPFSSAVCSDADRQPVNTSRTFSDSQLNFSHEECLTNDLMRGNHEKLWGKSVYNYISDATASLNHCLPMQQDSRVPPCSDQAVTTVGYTMQPVLSNHQYSSARSHGGDYRQSRPSQATCILSQSVILPNSSGVGQLGASGHVLHSSRMPGVCRSNTPPTAGHISYSEVARQGASGMIRKKPSAEVSQNVVYKSKANLQPAVPCKESLSDNSVGDKTDKILKSLSEKACDSSTSVDSENIKRFTKYGHDSVEICNSYLPNQLLGQHGSDSNDTMPKTLSAAPFDAKSADKAVSKPIQPKTYSVKTSKEQQGEKLFFDPRRIFAAETRRKPDVLYVSESVAACSLSASVASCCSMDSTPTVCNDCKLVDRSSKSSAACTVSNSEPENGTSSLGDRSVDSSKPEIEIDTLGSLEPNVLSEQQTNSESTPDDKTNMSDVPCGANINNNSLKRDAADDIPPGETIITAKRGKGRSVKEPGRNKNGRSKHLTHQKSSNVRGSETRSIRRKASSSMPDDSVGTDKNLLSNLWSWLNGERWQKIFVCSTYEIYAVCANIMKIVIGILAFELWGMLKSFWQCAAHIIEIVVNWVIAKTRKWRRSKTPSGVYSLSENIMLPSTGEEAMRRLFDCKGKDPYSILGLRVDCSDDDIKRYYRRQAVLVHPDKNHEPGAEEAFKILNHAFEMIGDPVKRQQYDLETVREHENDAAMKEFTDLLTKLHEVMKEGMNVMACNFCGGKHRRYPTDLTAARARYCTRCNEHHPAKEGDVWAESTMLGFRWHYFACMDGDIYNITEWAKCQHDDFKHIKANSHFVMMHISTGAKPHSRASGSEADIEQFLNNIFGAAAAAQNGASGNPFANPSFKSPPGGSTKNPQSSSAGTSASQGKRKKKRR